MVWILIGGLNELKGGSKMLKDMYDLVQSNMLGAIVNV